MFKSDYFQHDAQYKYLRERGLKGWGGEHLERRMLDWNATINRLLACEVFPKKNASILEIGSGAGDSLLPLAKYGHDVTGIEISPTAVTWAKEKFKEQKLTGSFIIGDLAKGLPFADSLFDVVLDAACLHCLINEDRKKTLREVQRVLKPNGFFLVSHMVNDPKEMEAGLVFNTKDRTQERDGVVYRSMPTYDQLIEDVTHAGFEIIHVSLRENPWWDHAELWCTTSPANYDATI